MDSPTSGRPAAAYLLGSGFLGFVLGAFLVASLGSSPLSGGTPTKTNRTPPPTAAPAGLDEAGGAVETPAPTPGPPPAATTGRVELPPVAGAAGGGTPLADRHLEIPVQGIQADQLVRSYSDARSGGREHEALDIPAPRSTPVLAVEDGTVAKLFLSKAGGITIYQFDPRQEYCYYYAHLERYEDGLKEGDRITRGQVIGYVGTTGNAPKDTPHLHFAIFRLTPEKHWWEGTPLDPYDVFAGR